MKHITSIFAKQLSAEYQLCDGSHFQSPFVSPLKFSTLSEISGKTSIAERRINTFLPSSSSKIFSVVILQNWPRWHTGVCCFCAKLKKLLCSWCIPPWYLLIDWDLLPYSNPLSSQWAFIIHLLHLKTCFHTCFQTCTVKASHVSAALTVNQGDTAVEM